MWSGVGSDQREGGTSGEVREGGVRTRSDWGVPLSIDLEDVDKNRRDVGRGGGESKRPLHFPVRSEYPTSRPTRPGEGESVFHGPYRVSESRVWDPVLFE